MSDAGLAQGSEVV